MGCLEDITPVSLCDTVRRLQRVLHLVRNSHVFVAPNTFGMVNVHYLLFIRVFKPFEFQGKTIFVRFFRQMAGLAVFIAFFQGLSV